MTAVLRLLESCLVSIVLLASAWIQGDITAAPAKSTAPALDYLIVVDTSFSMTRLDEQVFQWIYELVASGFEGRIRPNEVYSIWTFNEKVHTDFFSPKVWTPELNRLLAGDSLRFLKMQKFVGRTFLPKLMKELEEKLARNPNLVVFLVSDGRERLHGTPFDQAITAACVDVVPRIGRVRKPLLITLVAREGQYVAWSLTLAGNALAYPDLSALEARKRLPADSEIAKALTPTIESKRADTSAPGPKSAESAPLPVTPNTVATPATPPITPPAPAPTVKPTATATPPLLAETKTVEPAAVTPPPLATIPPPSPPAQTPAPAPAQKPVSPVPEPSPPAAQTAVELPSTTTAAPNPPPQQPQAPATAAPSTPPTSPTASETQPALATVPTVPVPQSVETPTPPTDDPVVSKPAPKEMATPPVAPAPPAVTSSTPPPAMTEVSPKPKSPPPGPNAIGLPGRTWTTSRSMMVAGAVFLVAAVLLLAVYTRSRRAPRPPSLISQSLDRKT